MIMISEYWSAYFSRMWDVIAPVLGDHLWQSTLFAVAAGLLTLVLRKHHARTRYWLWLAASVKFLVPFSLLAGLGSYLSWSRGSEVAANHVLYVAIEEFGQPFTQSAAHPSSAAAHAVASTSLFQFLPALIAVWVWGFFVVLLVWSARWRRVSAAIESATPLCEGREVGALRRIECAGGVRHPIEVLLSPGSLEPGIFGISRPVLIWPEGISERLEDAQLDAILAHEVWHVRRRDNLFAALHMLVEAIFWFHPLVWWLGSRLVEERERACDEEVVELGSDRQVYAQSILKVCEFCLGSPLVCVSGVTGADLKKRMVHIMSARILHKLDFARKLLLSTAALLAIALPITFGLLNATPSRAQSPAATMAEPAQTFETVSIKPSRSADDRANQSKVMFSLEDRSFIARGVTLQFLVKLAYQVQDSQLSVGQDWMNGAKYDVDARMSNAEVEELRKASMEQRKGDQVMLRDQGMLQALLRDHFKLELHPETKNLPVYDLVVDKNGPKLQESNGPRMMRMEKGELTSEGTHLAFLADQLSLRLGRTVVDKTGLKGYYSYTLRWTPDVSEEERLSSNGMPSPPAASSPEVSGPPLATAVQEQLGLKLEPRTDAVQVLVIDHAETPSEN
jgi:bla regulator protein blaR1